MHKKKKVLGPHKFLHRHEGAVASSQGAAVQHDKEMDKKAIHDMVDFSIKHAKQEGYVVPHHEVFKHHEFLEVGEGKTYETVVDDIHQPIEPPIIHTAATIAEMESTRQIPTRQSSPISPLIDEAIEPPIEFVD